MPKIPFVGPFNQARSVNVNAERAVNCFLEFDESNERAPLALYGTPGTVLRFTLPTYPVRAAIRVGFYSYWLAGNTVYRVDPTFSYQSLGTIDTSSGSVGIATNGTQVLIVDGFSGWIAEGTTLTEISDPDFPAGVRRAAYQDSFFIVTGDGSQKFYINETPNAGEDWNGLDFASAEGSPDENIAVLSDHRELWLLGVDSTEIWTNTGAEFPFERSGNTFIEHGCAAAATADKLDNSVFWLGQDDNGGAMVLRAQGYQPARISTHALEAAMQNYGTIGDAFAFTFQMEGHSFYALTFPSANASWLYDVSTGLWTEWAWRHPTTGQLHRHRSNCHIYYSGEHLVGDFENGKVYALRMDAYDDAGDPMVFMRRTQCTDSKDGALNFYEALIINMETGVGLATGQGSDPLVRLRYSNDGGHTWSNVKTRSIGAVGQYGKQVRFGPTGKGRNRVWEVVITDPVKRAIYGAEALIERGD